MHLLEYVWLPLHMHLGGGSNPCRIIPLLGIAYPVEGKLFQVQGVFGKTMLIRGRF